MNLLIYYNPNQKNFYLVYTSYIFITHKVGYINGYGHMLVQILVVRDKKYLNINDYSDLSKYSRDNRKSFKQVLIERSIRWLNKYRE